MPIIHSKAIILSSLKYGDTSLIVKCFTLEEGIKSYMIKGVLKSKKGAFKPAHFQPLNQLQLVANHKLKSTLHSLKEVQVIHPYNTIHTSIIKQTIVLFLSEVLSSIIQEEEKNEGLYTYIETALIWLDTHTDISNFHLLFLLNLTKFLGFYPDISASHKKGFNLVEGKFTDTPHEKLTLSGTDLTLFKTLLGINFDTINRISFGKQERQRILRFVIKYFELHLEGYRKPKSLDILETVFS